VGVIAELALWFAAQTFRVPGGSVDWVDVAVAALTLAGLQRWNWNVVYVVLACAGCGILRHALGL
jgi:hypothetical protein